MSTALATWTKSSNLSGSNFLKDLVKQVLSFGGEPEDRLVELLLRVRLIHSITTNVVKNKVSFFPAPSWNEKGALVAL